MTSHGGLLQPKLNGGDTLLQLTSTILRVRRPNSTGKSRIGSSTLTYSEIATEKELWSWKSEGISERTVPWESAIIIHTFISYSYCSSVPSISDSGTENEDQRLSNLS